MDQINTAFSDWLQRVTSQFCSLNDQERNITLDTLIAVSGSSQLLMLSSFVPNLVYRDFICSLPLEISIHILGYLNGEELLICCQVSRSWNYRVSGLDKLWQQMAEDVGVSRTYSPHHTIKQCDDLQCQNETCECILQDNSIPSVQYKTLYLQALKLLKGLSKGTSIVVKTNFITKNAWRISAVRFFNGCVVTGCDDHTVQVWSVPDGSVLHSVSTNSVCCLTLCGHHLYTASFNANAECWNLYSGLHVKTFVGHTSAVLAIDVIPDETFLLTGSVDKTAKLWDLRSSRMHHLLRTFDSLHEDWVFHVKFLPRDGENLCMLTCDSNTICLWKTSSSGDMISSSHLSIEGSAKFTSFYHHPINICQMFACSWTEWTKCSDFVEYAIHTSLCNLKETQSFNIPLVGIKPYLLGAGLKFAVIMCSISRKDFHVIDVQKQDVIATVNTPSFYILTRNGSTVTLCDTGWLDGFKFSEMKKDVPVFAAWIAADKVMLGTWASHIS